MADRTNQHLVVYKKDNTKVVEGEKGAKTVSIIGLAPNTVVAEGDYLLAWSDGTNESDKVNVPAFTVLTEKVQSSENVTVTPTANGSSLTAE